MLSYVAFTAEATKSHFSTHVGAEVRRLALGCASFLFTARRPDWVPWTTPLYPEDDWSVFTEVPDPERMPATSLFSQTHVTAHDSEPADGYVARMAEATSVMPRLQGIVQKMWDTFREPGIAGFTVAGADLTDRQASKIAGVAQMPLDDDADDEEDAVTRSVKLNADYFLVSEEVSNSWCAFVEVSVNACMIGNAELTSMIIDDSHSSNSR